jgi:hypothetical protein
LVAADEAGPTRYALHRQLTGLGVECMVVAPSLIPVRSDDRVRTDRRGVLKLARLLRSGDLTPIWVPDQDHEALRYLVRSRADPKADELRGACAMGRACRGGQGASGPGFTTVEGRPPRASRAVHALRYERARDRHGHQRPCWAPHQKQLRLRFPGLLVHTRRSMGIT